MSTLGADTLAMHHKQLDMQVTARSWRRCSTAAQISMMRANTKSAHCIQLQGKATTRLYRCCSTATRTSTCRAASMIMHLKRLQTKTTTTLYVFCSREAHLSEERQGFVLGSTHHAKDNRLAAFALDHGRRRFLLDANHESIPQRWAVELSSDYAFYCR